MLRDLCEMAFSQMRGRNHPRYFSTKKTLEKTKNIRKHSQINLYLNMTHCEMKNVCEKLFWNLTRHQSEKEPPNVLRFFMLVLTTMTSPAEAMGPKLSPCKFVLGEEFGRVWSIVR